MLDSKRLRDQLGACEQRHKERLDRREAQRQWARRVFEMCHEHWTTVQEALASARPRRLVAQMQGPPATTHSAPERPSPITVVATDGSQIYPDRPVEPAFFLLNVSRVAFQYGTIEESLPDTVPTLHFRADLDVQEMPMVDELLSTTVRAQMLACRGPDGEIRKTLPPQPPDIHDFEYPCTEEQVPAVGVPDDFLRTLVEYPDPSVPIDDHEHLQSILPRELQNRTTFLCAFPRWKTGTTRVRFSQQNKDVVEPQRTQRWHRRHRGKPFSLLFAPSLRTPRFLKGRSLNRYRHALSLRSRGVPRANMHIDSHTPMSDEPSSRETPSRRKIVRDLVVFQVKLWLEGFKDFVLMPVSLGAALLDVLFRGTTGQGTLYAVMRLGDRFERWVNLYGSLDEQSPDGTGASLEATEDLRRGSFPEGEGDTSTVGSEQHRDDPTRQ